jgi:hypothetical protein
MKKPVNPDQQWIMPDGRPTLYFLELVQQLSKNSLELSATAPTNGQVMIYNGTTKLWDPGAN